MLQIDFSASMTASELRSICLVHGLYSVAKKAKSRYIAAIQAFNDDIEAATEVQAEALAEGFVMVPDTFPAAIATVIATVTFYNTATNRAKAVSALQYGFWAFLANFLYALDIAFNLGKLARIHADRMGINDRMEAVPSVDIEPLIALVRLKASQTVYAVKTHDYPKTIATIRSKAILAGQCFKANGLVWAESQGAIG